MKFILILIVFGAVNVGVNSTDDGHVSVQNIQKLLKAVLQLDPDTGLSIEELIDKYNYTLESHQVITEDGYILTLHRIPHRKPDGVNGTEHTTEENISRPVVLLVHGMVGSSAVWFCQGPNGSLPFQLVDQGYDVWLANARGNIYASKHVNLTTEDQSFWNFSFHEIGYYDLPSSIDYILNATKVDKITYIGHSQGTTAGAVLTSSRPEYNAKLNLMVMFSPAIYLTQVRSPVFLFIEKYNEVIKKILDFVEIYALEHSELLERLLVTFCNDQSPAQGMCILLIESIAGYDVEQLDKSKLTVFFTHTPSGSSYKIIDHYVQFIRSGIFRQFDNAPLIENEEQHRSLEPAPYDIEQISAPVAVYYSKNDFIVSVQGAEKFISELKTEIVDQYLVEFDDFNHLDFATAKDVKTLLYDRVVGVIQKYNPLPGK